MLAVAATHMRVFHPRMDTQSRNKTPPPSAVALGQALKSLRSRAGIKQTTAAKAIGVSRQAWGNYEAGRDVVLREDIQEDLAKAIGVTRDDLLRERDRLTGGDSNPLRPAHAGGNVYELPVIGRVRAGPSGPQVYSGDEAEQSVDLSWMFGPDARSLRVAGDTMTGYVESGQLVIYDTSQWPRRGDGCVVELTNGDLHVSEYVSTAQGVLTVRIRFPEESLSFPMSTVKGVYKIALRGG
jgi:DNA-binding XRE family transcriptional regulator